MPRGIRPKAFNDVRYRIPHRICCLNSAANAGSGKKRQLPVGITEPAAPAATDATIDLENHEKLYASFKTWKLLKSWVTLHMAATKSMADLGSLVMNSRAMKDPVVKRTVVNFTERTFFDHFCGGKDLEEAATTARKLRIAGLNTMLDYGLEHSNDNDSCDRNMSHFLLSIGWTKTLESPCVTFTVLKITAICPPRLLKRISDLLRWEYKSADSGIHLPWKLNTLPIFTPGSALYHTRRAPLPLTPEEEKDLELAYNRLDNICRKSMEANVPLLIDAEDTSIQPAIDYLTYSAAIMYKTLANGEPLIFNTIQAYLTDAVERLVTAKKAADVMGIPLGFKLVRGAYMSSENELALHLGVKSPIHKGIHNTHESYNSCAEFMLNEIAKGNGSVVLATHNVESGKLAAAKSNELGIKKENPHLQFAQLYGMSEALSFALRHAGFKVSKYVPFGPIEQIMPYLLRRAEENKGLLSTSSLDKRLMRKELLRRLKSRFHSRQWPGDQDFFDSTQVPTRLNVDG